jgi:hypothetical protein
MNILGGHESYNTPAKKWCKWWRSWNETPPYTTLNIYTLLNVFLKHKHTKKILRGSHLFPKNLKGPIKRTLGSPRLHLFVERKSSTISTVGKKRHLDKRNDSTDRKSNEKRAKTSEARQKITKGNQLQVEERGGGRDMGV